MSLDQNSGVMNLGWPRPGDLEEGLFLFIDLSRYGLVLLLPKAGKSVKKKVIFWRRLRVTVSVQRAKTLGQESSGCQRLTIRMCASLH